MTQPSFPFALPEDGARRDHLAGVGQLASGLVHELKNPLGVVMLNTELLLQQDGFKPAERERAERRLNRILESARSLQSIIQSFLTFAKPGRPERDPIDLNGLLEQLLDEQAEQLGAARIKAAYHPDAALALVPGDPQQLRSIFLNVIDNARDALLDRADDRRLLVVTRSGPGQARVVVANNGPALSEEIAAHMFEPFYSSKERGTGLGLAIVRRLVELHGGTVEVSSDRDQGVSFTFEFPTPLGPATPRASLPFPDVEAQVREDTCGVRGAACGVRETETKDAVTTGRHRRVKKLPPHSA
ncbi:MAG: HAMP domain-containing histidine kinase, partial [Planctomycetes bacterium]|nr:HAMP domain-containing histidine kinase [Planctomycetota bacterium]